MFKPENDPLMNEVKVLTEVKEKDLESGEIKPLKIETTDETLNNIANANDSKTTAG